MAMPGICHALIVRPSDNRKNFDKRVKMVKVLADVRNARSKEMAGVALVINFKSK